LRTCPGGSGPPFLAHTCRSFFTAVDAYDRGDCNAHTYDGPPRTPSQWTWSQD